MRDKALSLLVALLIAPALARAQPAPREDHLEPETSVVGGTAFLSSYDALLSDLLHDAYNLDVEVRMLAIPSFSPEYAVGLRDGKTVGKGDFKATTRGAPYRIFVLSPSAKIWTYESIAALKRGQEKAFDWNGNSRQKEAIAREEAKVPADPHDLKIDRCDAAISDGLGDRIVRLWGKVALATHYSAQYSNGLDGISYHFSAVVSKAGLLAGQVWSPPRDSVTGTLVALADTMRAVCEKKASEAQLEGLTAELEQRIKQQDVRK